jgi:hypothetical protein
MIPWTNSHPTMLARRSLCCVVLWFGCVVSVFSNASNAGVVVSPVLGNGMGAKGTALGEAFGSWVEDPSALYWNPAGLGRIRRVMLQVECHRMPMGGFDQGLLGAIPVGSFGVLGWEAIYRDYGFQDGYDLGGASAQGFTPRDFSVALGWAIALHPRWSIGARTLWFQQKTDRVMGSGVHQSLGVMAGPWSGFRWSLALKNMGLDSSGYPPPFQMVVGASRSTQWGSQGRHGLILAAGLDHRPRGRSRTNMALEYTYQQRLSIRTGWTPRWNDNALDLTQGWSCGAGFVQNAWGLDYSLVSQAELGWEHRVAISWCGPVRPAKGRVPDPKGASVSTPSSNLGQTPPSIEMPPFPVFEETPALSSAREASAPGAEPVVILQFQAVEEFDPLWTTTELFQRGEKILSQGNIEKALAFYRKCVEKDARFEKAWVRISQIERHKSDAAAQKALELNPDNAALRRWLEAR